MSNRKPGLAGKSSRIQNIRSRETSKQRDHRKGRDRSAHASKRNTESASNINQCQVVDRARAQRRQDQETSPEICQLRIDLRSRAQYKRE